MRKGKILLVDDNVDMILIGQRIFTRAGFEYVSARSGQEGLQKIQHDRPDLVVLDYVLPDINGTDFIKTVAEDSDYRTVKNIPIVILTARTDQVEDLDACFTMGLRAFLNKPFGQRELVNVVENIIRVSQIESERHIERKEEQTEEPPAGKVLCDPAKIDELRTAASTIASLAKEMQSGNFSNLTERQCIDLNAIYTSSRRLVRIVDDNFPKNQIAHNEPLYA